MPRAPLRRALVAAPVGGLLALALPVLVDRGLARFAPAAAGLVLPPGTVVRYETTEFSFEVASNALGFRGPLLAEEPPAGKDAPVRIVAVGDSFTYGWGVAEDETWPAVLERLLCAAGHQVEVANLGQGGVATAEYAATCERALPVLGPELVVIGVLQADDLAQALEVRAPEGAAAKAKALVRGAFPELLRHWRARRTEQAVDIRPRWHAQAQAVVAALEGGGARWYQDLPPELRASFEAGDLNPGLVTLARAHPGHLVHTLELDAPATLAAIETMAAHLARIRAVAEAEGAAVLVVSLPHAAFFSEANRETYRALGYRVDERFEDSTAMDEALARAADRAGVAFVTLTGCFRAPSPGGPLFYPRDGHPNVAGYARIAECLVDRIGELVGARGTG